MCSRYRSDVVGSMLRHPDFSAARESWQAGRLETRQFKALEDYEVDLAIATQEQAGLDVINDGELRRYTFLGTLEAVNGITKVPAKPFRWYGEDPADDFELVPPYSITSKMSRRQSVVTEEYAYARARATKPLKVTLPSPMMLVYRWNDEHTREAYPSPRDAFEDGAKIVREEIRDLVSMGCRYIQVDAPEFTLFLDERQHGYIAELGLDPHEFLRDGVELLNTLPIDAPDVQFGIHLCRGNNAGRHMSAGGYDAMSKEFFGRLRNYHRLLLEYDTPRAGSFEALRDVPEHMTVVLGLVSSKVPTLEDPEQLLRRIDEAATCFPRDQLALSTQCGFAFNPLTADDQRSKLRLVAETAARAWS